MTTLSTVLVFKTMTFKVSVLEGFSRDLAITKAWPVARTVILPSASDSIPDTTRAKSSPGVVSCGNNSTTRLSAGPPTKRSRGFSRKRTRSTETGSVTVTTTESIRAGFSFDTAQRMLVPLSRPWIQPSEVTDAFVESSRRHSTAALAADGVGCTLMRAGAPPTATDSVRGDRAIFSGTPDFADTTTCRTRVFEGSETRAMVICAVPALRALRWVAPTWRISGCDEAHETALSLRDAGFTVMSGLGTESPSAIRNSATGEERVAPGAMMTKVVSDVLVVPSNTFSTL